MLLLVLRGAFIKANFLNCISRLNDTNSLVRENAIIILTHLILHDFVRIKGLISEAAKCIADSNVKISSVARYLFAELSRKVSYLCIIF